MNKMDKKGFARLRKKIVESQLLDRGISDVQVIKAIGSIPREEFVLARYRNQAYIDGPLPIGFGQTISQLYIVALMCQLLELKGKERVLDVGTGSGYQAAVLSLLVEKVISIERVPQLAKRAKEKFKKLGFRNIQVVIGDGSMGFKKEAPFEAIICGAASKTIPEAWREQLASGGRIVFPLKDKDGYQELVRVTKRGGRFIREEFGGVVFVPLISKEGNYL